MDLRVVKSFSDHLLAGGSVVAAGSAAGLWLPLGLGSLLLCAIWGRVLWMEERDAARDPQLRLRGWTALGWAVAAGAVLHAVVPITLAAGALALFLALRQADYMALAAARRGAVSAPRRVRSGDAANGPLPRRPD
jgi:hypothetical protein